MVVSDCREQTDQATYNSLRIRGLLHVTVVPVSADGHVALIDARVRKRSDFMILYSS
jgi:hypothetical protein